MFFLIYHLLNLLENHVWSFFAVSLINHFPVFASPCIAAGEQEIEKNMAMKPQMLSARKQT